MPAYSATERADWARAKTDRAKKGKSKIIHIPIWQGRMTASDGSKAYE